MSSLLGQVVMPHIQDRLHNRVAFQGLILAPPMSPKMRTEQVLVMENLQDKVTQHLATQAVEVSILAVQKVSTSRPLCLPFLAVLSESLLWPDSYTTQLKAVAFLEECKLDVAQYYDFYALSRLPTILSVVLVPDKVDERLQSLLIKTLIRVLLVVFTNAPPSGVSLPWISQFHPITFDHLNSLSKEMDNLSNKEKVQRKRCVVILEEYQHLVRTGTERLLMETSSNPKEKGSAKQRVNDWTDQRGDVGLTGIGL